MEGSSRGQNFQTLKLYRLTKMKEEEEEQEEEEEEEEEEEVEEEEEEISTCLV